MSLFWFPMLLTQTTAFTVHFLPPNTLLFAGFGMDWQQNCLLHSPGVHIVRPSLRADADFAELGGRCHLEDCDCQDSWDRTGTPTCGKQHCYLHHVAQYQSAGYARRQQRG